MVTDTAKVIRLEPEVQRHVRARMARLPAGVHAFNEAGKKLIGDYLIKYFESADDALFDMADKAQSNQDQNVYFDSMREVRMQRKSVENRFMDTIEEGFARLVAQDERDSLKNSGELSAEALSLVQNEDLEQLVALESTVTRANRQYAVPIHMAAAALSPAVPTSVDDKNYPFGPMVLCAAMMSQIKRLDIDIKAKLVLFKLYDRTVISQLDGVYQQLVEVLALNGLKSTVGSAARKTPSSNVVRPQHSPASAASENLNRVPVNTQLQEVLSFIQKLPVSAATEQGIDIERVIASVQHHRGIELKLQRIERETINLVHMMFRFLLRDYELATPLRELICRLQVPILRMALSDRKFFEEKRHPARRLLNEFAAGALQWDSAAQVKPDDQLFVFMKATVDRLLTLNSISNDHFEEALTEFSCFVEKDRRRSAVLEKRTVDAEDGKARATQARKTVANEVEWRTRAHNLPAVVRELVDGPWSNVLFVTGLKYGFESSEWNEQLKVLSDLVWSVQACSGKSDRQKLIRLIPDLIQRMRRGLDAISFNPFEVSELFSGLEEVHLARIRGEALPYDRVDNPSADLAVPDLAEAMAALAIETAALATETPSPTELIAEDDSSMLTVSGFAQGAWFDLNYGCDDVLRCRLAAYIKPTGKYIFVNRSGAKVAEKTQHELALALKQGHLRMVDNSMLFDRALESVVTGLRKNKNGMPLDLT